MRLPRWTVYPALALLAVFLVPAIPRKQPPGTVPSDATATRFPRMVVLGVDGLDPEVLAEVIARHPERTANFARLVREGGLNALGTSTPPQSPVAWSNFTTGLDPGGHGIFDFIHRDPVTRQAVPSTTKSSDPTTIPFFAGLQFPLGGDSESNRTGTPFWKTLADNGVPAFIWRMPANYPVEPAKGLSFSGMMTPAIDSAYGKYTYWTSDMPAEMYGREGKVVFAREFAGVIDTALTGPENPFRKEAVTASIPMKIYVDHESGAATIELADHALVLSPGQWSDFVRVSFDLLPGGAAKLPGIVRFYLRRVDPAFELYASPINIDPLDPITPVSAPKRASADVARAVGLYYTQGMPEDVNALKEHVIDDLEFLQQSDLVHDEGVRLMDWAVDRWLAEKDGGFLFFYFSGVDLCGHMMWRHRDAQHPAHDAAFAAADSSAWSRRAGSHWRDVIEDLYLRMDPVIGRLRSKLPEGTTLVVMSDHGFESYRRKFSLNTWLLENGYLVLKAGKARELPRDDPNFEPIGVDSGAVDWSKTRAYGVGFNGLYLNLMGRERDDPRTPDEDESGIVRPGAEAEALIAEIRARLESLRDGTERVVARCDAARGVYRGARVDEAPDLIVGYDAGYGNSDESSVGRIPHDVLADNRGGTFNGSHLMSPDVVPGTLLSNRPVRAGLHQLEDLTVEILKRYGITPPADLRGAPVLK